MISLRNAFRPVLLLSGFALIGGCSWGFGGGKGEVPEMHRNFSRTFDIQTGVVRGDLSQAREAASWLMSREEEMVFPPGTASYRNRMLESAAGMARAPDLQTVAAETGNLAAACGGCHLASGAGPRFVVGSSTPQGDSRQAQMIRHLWAADRMWEGLVGPSEEAWSVGAEALAQDAPVLAQALQASNVSGGSAALVEEVASVAREARDARDAKDRARAYGRMMNTCNRCHTAAGIMANLEG